MLMEVEGGGEVPALEDPVQTTDDLGTEAGEDFVDVVRSSMKSKALLGLEPS